MPRARIDVDLSHEGASLKVIARELLDMDEGKVADLFQAKLEDAARPFVPLVQASVMATPRKRLPSPGGLRSRIARTVEVASWQRGPQTSVAVEVQPQKMPDREYSLPLYYEGAKPRWRHPVFGNTQVWVGEDATPFFYQAADGFGRAAADALGAALDDITRDLSG